MKEIINKVIAFLSEMMKKRKCDKYLRKCRNIESGILDIECDIKKLELRKQHLQQDKLQFNIFKSATEIKYPAYIDNFKREEGFQQV
jgi:hypothetical protein